MSQALRDGHFQFYTRNQPRSKMKKQSILLLTIGFLQAALLFGVPKAPDTGLMLSEPMALLNDEVKKQALAILESKCNVCHRKKNPFMIFKNQNMDKRAVKIYRMVFQERKMPKGNEIKLTSGEYDTLKEWIYNTIN